ncbi:plasmid mobilization protein [Streptococcus canis]|uniref:PcfF n=1 Tax=Streptococcus canis FSL Z3-227 TaxID=482234 RepID=A0AAV3FUQ1_STRCB|nr:plasmid mobilization relaxosome protein MobC [Streptococcus canis]EIQ82672.1 PcfF [Streptococcus canis FSL Z3-227]
MKEKRQPERKRNIQKLIFISEEERDKIRERMNEAGVNNFSKFARIMLLGGHITKVNLDEVNDARTALNRIGTNLNQIAKKVNEADAVTTHDVKEALLIMNEMKQTMNTILMTKVKQDNSLSDNIKGMRNDSKVSYNTIIKEALGDD